MLEPARLQSFDHYLDKSGLAKKLSLYEILQLDKSFFENYNENDFKKHVRNLQLEFHPDKNPENLDKATTVWKIIFPAIEKMRDPKTRENFLLGVESFNFTNFSNFNFEEWISEQANALDKLERELDSLSAQETEGGLSLVPQITFQALAETLDENTLLSSEELSGKFYKMLPRLEGLAETGQDFYTLFKLVAKDHITSFQFGPAMIAAAASRGHWISMRMTTGMALSGLFKDKNASIIWALNCIRYLEEVAIPYLNTTENIQDNHDLVEITEGLNRARARIDGPNGAYSQGKKIPEQNSNEFNVLVASIIQKIEKVASYNDFLLSNKIFSLVGSNPKVEDKHTLEQLKLLFETAARTASEKAAPLDFSIVENTPNEPLKDTPMPLQGEKPVVFAREFAQVNQEIQRPTPVFQPTEVVNYQEIPELLNVAKSVAPLTGFDQIRQTDPLPNSIIPLENSLPPFNQKMSRIVSEIVSNIKGEIKTSRFTHWNSEKKVKLLDGLLNLLQSDLLNNQEKIKPLVIALCHRICEIKRNPLGIFASHSSKELETLLKNERLPSPDSNVHFTNKEINDLFSNSTLTPDHFVQLLNQHLRIENNGTLTGG